MAKINGTYVSLHESSDSYPYYKGALEFRDTLCLAGHFFKKGPIDESDTYDFIPLPNKEDNMSSRQKARIEAILCGMLPDKALFFTESNSAHHMTYFTAVRGEERISAKPRAAITSWSVLNTLTRQSLTASRNTWSIKDKAPDSPSPPTRQSFIPATAL